MTRTLFVLANLLGGKYWYFVYSRFCTNTSK